MTTPSSSTPPARPSTSRPWGRPIAALALGAGLLAPAAVQALPPAASAAPAAASAAPAPAPERDRGQQGKAKDRFRIATLNLQNDLSAGQLRSDIRKVIAQRQPSIIGFQERRDTRRQMRAALPEHWALRMPVKRDGTDDNPIAFDKRVWKAKDSWARLLTGRTWQRNSGQTAVDQYGVVTVLEHRRTGQVVRAISFHMPNLIHNRNTGGPNYGEPQRLGAFYRMAASVRELARRTPEEQQFVALCDCNVTESRDTTGKLVKGKITRPLGLENQYSAAGYKSGWRIDYVMSEKDADYRIHGWHVMHRLHTDHPGVVTEFRPAPELVSRSYPRR